MPKAVKTDGKKKYVLKLYGDGRDPPIAKSHHQS
jgi:hypothetical protein